MDYTTQQQMTSLKHAQEQTAAAFARHQTTNGTGKPARKVRRISARSSKYIPQKR